MRRSQPACVADPRIGYVARRVGRLDPPEWRYEMKMRQMLAGFVALAAGAMIIMPSGPSLAAGQSPYSPQSPYSATPSATPNSSAPNFQSASLPPTRTVPQFSSQAPATNMVRPDYVIGPDDVIAIAVFQVPDLSSTVQVD